MIKHELLDHDGIMVVSPEGSLSEEDFIQLANAADPYIEAHGGLSGIMIYTETFPGWKDFSGLLSHLRFVKDHHHKIGKVALVTDSRAAAVAESLAKHFVSAEIRHFGFVDKAQALDWLRQS